MNEALRKDARAVRGGSGTMVTIRECCATRQQALVIAVATGSAHPACFHAASDEVVTFELAEGDAAHGFQRMAPAFVVYQLAGGANAFMAPVREIETVDGRVRLHMLPPTGAICAKGRAVFRIPLLEGHGLEVRVRAGRHPFVVATAVDISVAGIQVEFEPGEMPELDAGAVVDIELSYRGRTLTLHGLVRRRAKAGYGFSFPGCMTDGELSPRPELQEIVAGLQRHWMERRDSTPTAPDPETP